MVKKLNRKQYHSAIENKDNSRFVKGVVLPIFSTLLCLTALSTYVQAQSATDAKPTPNLSPSPAPPIAGVLSYGNQISVNGRTLPGTWFQRGTKANFKIYLSDGTLRQLSGVDFLNSSNPAKQPVQWFSSVRSPQILVGLQAGGYRYLDITNFATTAGWQIKVNGNILAIATPSVKLTDIKEQPANAILVNLDRPTPWQVRQELPVAAPQITPQDPDATTAKSTSPPNREWTITLDGIADPVLVQRYTPPPPAPLPNLLKQLLPLPTPLPTPEPLPTPQPLIKQVEVVNNQTIIRLSVPFGQAPLVSSLPNPNRLIIEIRPDAMVQRDIAWGRGLRWRQQFVNLGQERFGVVWLEVNPRTGLKLKPIVSNSDTLMGTAPLIQTAQRYLAAAAINGGYFNRNNRLPLGAIRQNGQWLSGPILNRGAIAWNDSGQFYFNRLTLLETLKGANNLSLPILTLNSGYIQSGVARYTPVWGANYTPLSDNEIILVVQKNQVINQLPAGKAGQIPVAIPQDGYLLVFRGNNPVVPPLGSVVSIESATYPGDFSRYPQMIAAGPLLVQNRQIVLDAKAEKFSDAFIAEKAIRSAICTTATGNLMIAAVQNRAGGAGPTLAEHAQLMQLMGCVNALNLDGGSSTSLYLGGQLLNRSPNTAARVHNGIGIFLPLRP